MGFHYEAWKVCGKRAGSMQGAAMRACAEALCSCVACPPLCAQDTCNRFGLHLTAAMMVQWAGTRLHACVLPGLLAAPASVLLIFRHHNFAGKPINELFELICEHSGKVRSQGPEAILPTTQASFALCTPGRPQPHAAAAYQANMGLLRLLYCRLARWTVRSSSSERGVMGQGPGAGHGPRTAAACLHASAACVLNAAAQHDGAQL